MTGQSSAQRVRLDQVMAVSDGRCPSAAINHDGKAGFTAAGRGVAGVSGLLVSSSTAANAQVVKGRGSAGVFNVRAWHCANGAAAGQGCDRFQGCA